MSAADAIPTAARAPDLFRRLMGPVLAVVILVLAEFAKHIVPAHPQVAAALLLLALAPIAYTGLKSGFWMAALAALILAVYTAHYVGPHDKLLTFTPQAWGGSAVMACIGFALAYPMSRIKLREDKMRAALEMRAQVLEARNRELVEANEALEAFGYVVSHDLKEPVRAVENYLDAARGEWPSEEGRAFVEQAYRANERLTRLLQGLLSYSHTSSLAATPRPLDLGAVLRSEACTVQYRTKLEERGGRIFVEGPLPRVIGDEVILAQMLGNLVLNAVRHNPKPAPRIVLRTAPAGEGRARIVVVDDGPGFPPEVIERFDGLRGNRPATIKSGFGLVIAHRAAQRLDGRIWLANTPGGGGEVHIDLPAAPAEPKSVAAASPSLASPSSAGG